MTYVIHPTNEAQEKAIKAVLEALQVPYDEEPEVDETTHLLSSKANADRLNQSIASAKAGNLTAIKLQDLWK